MNWPSGPWPVCCHLEALIIVIRLLKHDVWTRHGLASAQKEIWYNLRNKRELSNQLWEYRHGNAWFRKEVEIFISEPHLIIVYYLFTVFHNMSPLRQSAAVTCTVLLYDGYIIYHIISKTLKSYISMIARQMVNIRWGPQLILLVLEIQHSRSDFI